MLSKGDIVRIKDDYWRPDLAGRIFVVRSTYLAYGGPAVYLEKDGWNGFLMKDLELLFTK